MKKIHSNTISNQRNFFNLNAKLNKAYSKKTLSTSFFDTYINAVERDGFNWLADCSSILEYGCGTGNSIRHFLNQAKRKNYKIYGVDIADEAIKIAKKRFPKYIFWTIKNNNLSQMKNNSLDAVYMLHLLHHATQHSVIFKSIHLKLKKNGKLLINDLTSGNFFVSTARNIFYFIPSFIKRKFSDDLVVDGKIPDKYKIYPNQILSSLERSGYKIEEVKYAHLFFFLFGWIDRIVPLSKTSFIRKIYSRLISFENTLLKYDFFQKQAELISIKAVKQ